MQTELCKLATKHGTDKAGWYTPVYDLLLKGKQVRNMLEIGVGTPEAMKHVPGYEAGASLRMWREYFPLANVWGADIVPMNNKFIRQVDQGNEAQLQKLAEDLGPFDLVIDDGSHKPHHQILGAKVFRPFINPGGLYIIEDVNNFDEVMQGLEMFALCISYPNPYKHAARCMVIRG